MVFNFNDNGFTAPLHSKPSEDDLNELEIATTNEIYTKELSDQLCIQRDDRFPNRIFIIPIDAPFDTDTSPFISIKVLNPKLYSSSPATGISITLKNILEIHSLPLDISRIIKSEIAEFSQNLYERYDNNLDKSKLPKDLSEGKFLITIRLIGKNNNLENALEIYNWLKTINIFNQNFISLTKGHHKEDQPQGIAGFYYFTATILK